MAIRKFKKINIIDLSAILIVIFLILTTLVFLSQEKKTYKDEIAVTVLVPDKTGLYEEALKNKSVYFNSTNSPVEVISVAKTKDANDQKSLLLTVKSKGEIGGEIYIFNGQRVLVGQKAEIHSGYFAQGFITEIKYADK